MKDVEFEERLEEIRSIVVTVLREKIEPLFNPEIKLALIAYRPGDEDCEIVITNGSYQELVGVAQRVAERDAASKAKVRTVSTEGGRRG